MNCRFSKKLRLLDSEQFRYVFQQAIKKQNSGIRLFARENNHTFSRLGIVVSKKDIPKAVTRNQMKRCIRESFRLNQQTEVGFDIIVMVKRRCLDLSNKEINQELLKLWATLASSRNFAVF